MWNCLIIWLYSVVAEKTKTQTLGLRNCPNAGRAEAMFWKVAGSREVWTEEQWARHALSLVLSPPTDAVFTHLCPQKLSKAGHRRSAGTVTSPFLSTGTLLDPEGLYDEEVCTPDNLQKYAIPHFPTCFRQFLQKPVYCLLFSISQIERCFRDCKKNQPPPKPNESVSLLLRDTWGRG